MKTNLSNYTFVASTKVVTLTDIATVRLDRLFAVINVTRGVTYYAAGTPSLLATVSGSTVTLNPFVSTAGHADSDKLLIIADDGTAEDGTDITAASMPAGGTGIRGWLSALYTNGVKLWDGTNFASISTTIADGMSATVNRLRVSAVNMAFNGTTVDAVRAGVIGDTGAATGYINSLPATGAVSGASLVGSTAYQSSRVLKASPGTLMSLMGFNSRTSAQFIQVFDSTTVPADGTAPTLPPLLVPAQSNYSIDVPTTGIPFVNGISVCCSSTGATKTIGSSDNYFAAVIK
jgi:hypothetical protein